MKHPAVVFAVLAGSLCAQQDPPTLLDPNAAGPAQRIWCADMQEQQVVWLRRHFAIEGKATAARLVFSCDNECTVFVNGVEVGASKAWEEVTVVDLEQLEQLDRDNVIAVQATNTGGPAALACWLCWTDAAGAHELESDPQWRVSTAPAAGWEAREFDGKDWVPATANFTAEFGRNVYNGVPTRIVVHNRYSPAADAIERGLAALRTAKDRDAALRALDDIERAVMAARRQVWARPAPQPAGR